MPQPNHPEATPKRTRQRQAKEDRMSDSSSSQPAITPAQANALKVFDGLPADQRNYATVAQKLNITEGRAADYVRQAWTKSGREGSPTGGKRGRRPSNAEPVVDDFTAQLTGMVERNREAVDRFSTEIDEARAAAEGFQPEEFVAAEGERLEQAAIEARARADAWQANEGDVATQAAEAEQKRLTEQADAITTRNEQALAKAEAALAQAEQMLALVSEQPTEQPTEQPAS
jgi:hypothetical protein